jgi:2-desacetyl-2-hydroxyethyl bacteriochlorophyllide A dehydrogenase
VDLEARALAAGRIEAVEVPRPDPGVGEVRVRVRRCGICGSDLHYFTGHSAPPGVCPGHEISGEVDAVGTGVSGWHEGDRVAIEPLERCGTCSRCLAGDYHLCRELGILGLTRAGGMATHVVTPAYTLFALPPSVDFALGALCEPLAVTVHGARLAGVREGARVLVLGAGTIGLLAIVAARRLGAGFVAATAKHAHQRDLALGLGCDQVLEPAAVDGLGERPEAVIETVGGTARTVGDAVRVIVPGGTVSIIGLFEETPAFEPLVMLAKEVRLVGSMTYNRHGAEADFDTALALLADRGEDLRPLLTHAFPLDRAQEAFQTAADKSTGAIKVAIEP